MEPFDPPRHDGRRKRHFCEFLRSEEDVSSNILADRLGRLSEEGMVTKAPDPTHKRNAVYYLTGESIALVPVFVQLGVGAAGTSRRARR